MARVKGPAPPRKLVWRISEAAPAGEWVDPTSVEGCAPMQAGLPEASSGGGWVMSSFDLLTGVDVSDEDVTVPGDLLDELFPPPGAVPRREGQGK